jgi:hypothetical protein
MYYFLTKTLGQEFRNTDVEVGIVTAEDREVKIMTPQEIERELTKIGESD